MKRKGDTKAVTGLEVLRRKSRAIPVQGTTEPLGKCRDENKEVEGSITLIDSGEKRLAIMNNSSGNPCAQCRTAFRNMSTLLEYCNWIVSINPQIAH